MDAPPAGRVEVRGATLAYELTGAGPDLLWGHGLSMNRASDATMALLDWDRIAVRVVRYDARGHGESTSTPELDGYSWAELARDQLALADALGIGRYVAAGASMGCGTALHVATLAPERIRALVLALPPTAWETRAAQADQWEAGAAAIESGGVEPFVAIRLALDPPDPYRGDESRREQQAAALRAWDPARLALVLRGAAKANLPDRAELAKVGVPALLLAWTGDPVHPLTTAEELASVLPAAELVVARTAEDLAGWTDRVRQFLSGLPER